MDKDSKVVGWWNVACDHEVNSLLTNITNAMHTDKLTRDELDGIRDELRPENVYQPDNVAWLRNTICCLLDHIAEMEDDNEASFCDTDRG
jgi:hypothetical protein